MIRIWELGAGPSDAGTNEAPRLREMTLSTGVNRLCFSPDGKKLAAAGNRYVHIVPFPDLAAARTWVAHDKPITCLAYSFDDKLLASGGKDYALRFWDDTGGRAASFHTHEEPRTLTFVHGSHDVVWGSLANFGLGRARPGAPDSLSAKSALHNDGVLHVASHARWGFLTASVDGTLKLWNHEFHELAVAAGGFGSIQQAALSAKGNWAAAVYADGAVRLWKLTEPPQRIRLGGASDAVFSGQSELIFSRWVYPLPLNAATAAQSLNPPAVTALVVRPGAATVALGRADGALARLDANRPDTVTCWSGHAAAVTSLATHPKGTLWLSGSRDGTLRVWDWTGESPQRAIAADMGEILRVAWSRDGRHLAAHGEFAVAVWDAADGRELWRSKHPWRHTCGLDFGPEHLAVGDADGAIALIEPATGSLVHRVKGHGGPITCLKFDPAGTRLASSGMDQEIHLCDAKTAAREEVLRHGSPAAWMSFHPSGKYLLAGSQFYDLSKNAPLITLFPDNRCGLFTPDGNAILLGHDSGSVPWCSVADLERKAEKQAKEKGGGTLREDLVHSLVKNGGPLAMVWGLAASSDGRWLASASHDESVRIWNAKTRQVIHTLHGHQGLVWCVAFSPDSRSVASGSSEARIWDVDSGKLLHRLQGHAQLVTSLVYHPYRPWLFSAARDGSVRRWHADTGEDVGILHQFPQALHKLALSPDGRWLAAACQDRTVALWDLDTMPADADAKLQQVPKHILSGHGHAAWAVDFSPKGSYLVSGSDDGVIVLRHGKSFTTLATLRTPLSSIRSLRFSPDERYLVAVAFPNGAMAWDINEVRLTLRDMKLDWKRID